jgi:hypothetical protein
VVESGWIGELAAGWIGELATGWTGELAAGWTCVFDAGVLDAGGLDVSRTDMRCGSWLHGSMSLTMYAGLRRSMETTTTLPLIRSLYVFSVRERT